MIKKLEFFLPTKSEKSFYAKINSPDKKRRKEVIKVTISKKNSIQNIINTFLVAPSAITYYHLNQIHIWSMIEIFQRGIVKSARKALERRVYECFGSNGNGSPGPTETPSNNSAPNGAPLDSKVQDPCRFVWIPPQLKVPGRFRYPFNSLYTVDREFYPHASEVGKDYEGEMGPSCSKKGV
ncbi:unnamed protein product [Rhizophagus irregularis]|nr:unnamed protein product [Rhizophagus irregularis]